ncbi:hypothetical protein SLE2022_307410 [Rubroshorea leprosula]
MEEKLIAVGRWWRAVGSARRLRNQGQNHELQFMRTTMKAANRAAVHGVRPPIPKTVHEEEVEKVIKKGKEEKKNKKKEIEKVVYSQTNSSKDGQNS